MRLFFLDGFKAATKIIIPSEIQGLAGLAAGIKEAVISAYCKENELPIQLFDGIETAESIQLKSYARRMAEVLTGIIMKRKGPQLICFWTRQGCPELPPSQE